MKDVFKSEHYEIATSIENLVGYIPWVVIVVGCLLILSMIPYVNRPIIRILDAVDEWLKPK